MTFKEFREAKGLTAAQMGRLLGTTGQTIGNIEKGLAISQRLAIRIELLSDGKIKALELTIPNYEEILAEEETRLEELVKSFQIFKKASGIE